MRVLPFYVSKYFSFYASFFFREHPVIRTHGAHLLAVDTPCLPSPKHGCHLIPSVLMLSAVSVLVFFFS